MHAGVRRILSSGLVALAASGGALAKTTESDWCTVESPDIWNHRVDTNGFDIVVTLKEGAPTEGNWLQPHVHWMKTMGYGGFAAWQNPRKTLEVGKPYKFHYKFKVDEDEVHRYAFNVYLAPNGDDKKKVKEQWVDVPLPPPLPYEPKPETATFKKSYIWLEGAPAPTKVGEDVVLKVHYYLDPSDTWGPKQSKLSVTPLGPWIDNPDGVINKSRTHVSYGGSMFTKEKRIEPGEHEVEFKFGLGTAYRYNSCFFLCKFKTPDNRDWPWDFRGGGLNVVPKNDHFRIYPMNRGGCFFFGETPVIALVWGDRCFGGMKKGRAVVRDCENRIVLEKDVELNPARRAQMLAFPELGKRGVFSLTVTAPEFGKDGADVEDFCYFATIPRFERIEGRMTPFGVTNVRDLDLSCLAYDLGFSLCRHFTSWKGIQPAKDRWLLEGLDEAVRNNNAAGLKPWIQLHGPPAWTLPPDLHKTGEFEPAPFDLKDWETTLLTLAKRYPKQLYGFEFMNELVPGNSCADPVKTYVDICRTGYTALKAYDRDLVCQLAGGLWPHSFRIDCLNAGIGKYVDVLPVHYSTYEGVREAQWDLAVRGIDTVAVADNETATGMTVWNYPPDMAFSASLRQCAYVMKRWPDELCAGAAFITYFGGGGDACGNWSYMLDITSPRPVVATLAVVQGKLAYAKPIGKFFIGETACHLFEKDGKSIVFLSTAGQEGVKVKLPANGAVTVTDYQGNATESADGTVVTGDMPVIAEGADLDALKLHAALFVGAAAAPTALPQHVTDFSSEMSLPVTVSNPFAAKRTFTVKVDADLAVVKPVPVTLEPGASKTFEIRILVKDGANLAVPGSAKLACTIASDALAAVAKPFVLYWTDDSSLGNLVKNPGFSGDGATWKGEGKLVTVAVPGDVANAALAIAGKGKGYVHHAETVPLPVPGGTYLYSAWVRGEGMGGGSNLDEYDGSGKHLKNYMMLNVFSVGGEGSKGWRYLSKRFTVKPDAKALAMTPVASGKDGARILYDNIQLALDKGSDYVAFASKDMKSSSPIPLLCENMVRAENGYKWTEKSLAGVGRFTWDADALVFEATVEDDVMAAKPVVSESGEETLKGDSIALCIFPRIGPEGRPENDQMRWYLSRVSPGGGSGLTTVYRPKKYAMGAKSGQLCKDSSVYQVDMKREGTLTTYRLRIPWSEIPGFSPAKGASFGCNLILSDSDGGAGLGRMVWGGGFKDDSADCGLVTLIP